MSSVTYMSMTEPTPSAQSTTAQSTSSSNNPNNNATTQPSSILFFIAVAIGVLIAIVFIFFSMRYYVRTRLGIYATARITTTNNSNGIVLLTGDFPMRSYNHFGAEVGNQTRHRRRRRYMKKRRLTEEEVEHLFPVRTYKDWLDGGAERDIKGRDIHDVLKEEDDAEIKENATESNEQSHEGSSSVNQKDVGQTTADSLNEITSTANDNITNDHMKETTTATAIATNDESADLPGDVDLGNPFQEEIHFDSGTCAICIDAFDSEDSVRGLICGHVFHQECLDPWLTKRKACCPMCKRDYYMKRNTGNVNGEENDEEEDAEMVSVNNYTTELQYTTLSERVAEIISRDPSIEERAKASIEKYLSLKWRIFWFVMGISRTDLINSAVVSEDQRTRDSIRPSGTQPRSSESSQPSEIRESPNTDVETNTEDRSSLPGRQNESAEEARERVERLA